MAQVIGARKRGRRKEALRLAAAELAAAVTGATGTKNVTVELVPGEGKRKGESVTLSIPKGAQVVPFDLTRDKADANAREQIRLGAADADAKPVSIRSTAVRLDNGEEVAVFHLEPK